jgi:hypothetical protein
MLKEHDIEEQLGRQPLCGCRDALFIVRLALQLRHKHMLPTWALFVDLVKAFDAIDRELMFQILSKFGIPKPMIYVNFKDCMMRTRSSGQWEPRRAVSRI